MRYTLGILMLLIYTNSSAENVLLGKWKDKNNPDLQYEFAKHNDFIYTNEATALSRLTGKNASNVIKGVWEIDASSISNNNTCAKPSCRLTIYARTEKCYLDYKFIGKNLIFTGEGTGLCVSRVLIHANDKK